MNTPTAAPGLTAPTLLLTALASMPGVSIAVFDLELRIESLHGDPHPGYLPGPIVGRRVPDVLPAPAWERVGPLYAAALAGRTTTAELAAPDGEAVHETTLSPVLADGQVVGGMAVSRDISDRAASAAALRRSKRDFRMLAESTSDIFTRSAPDGRLLYVSPAVKTILGVEPSAYGDAVTWEHVHPEDRARVLAARRQALDDGRAQRVEFRTQHADGRQRWLSSQITAIRDEPGGEIVELHATTRNVTPQRVADELRHQSQLTFEKSTRGIVIAEPATLVIRSVNPAFAQMHGGEQQDFVGRSLASVCCSSPLAAVSALTSSSRAGPADDRLHYEDEHLRPDGSRFPVDVDVIAPREADGREPDLIAFVTDLSEHRARESSERLAIEQFESAFREAPVGMLLIRGGRIERANAAIADVLGADAAELVGREPVEFIHPDDVGRHHAALRTVAAGGLPPEQDRRVVGGDGTVRHMRLRYSVLSRDDDAEPLALVHLADRTAEVAVAAELNRASAQFETSFSAAPIGMALVAVDGRFLRVNAALCHLLGRTNAELLATDFTQLTHPEDLAGDLALLGETLEGRRDGYELDKRYLRPNGEVIDARLSVSLVRDEAGRPAHFVSQIVDLTLLEVARRELSEAKSRLQAFLDHSPMALYMRDLQQRWVVTNPETCRIIGQTEAQLLGRSLADTHAPELYAHLATHDAEVIASGVPKSFEEVAPDARTGQTHHWWSLKFPVRDDAGQVIGLGGVSVDVTERERAARELAAAHELFEAIFDSAPVGKLVSRVLASGGTEITQCNSAFAHMLGREPQDIVGRSGHHLMHPDDAPERKRMIADALAGRPASAEVRFKHRDGHDVWTLASPSAALGPDDERLIVLEAVDISERKRFEGQLQYLADHDALTGLISRRRFEEELQREVSRTQRYGHPGSLLLLDLDGFKHVNDGFGHSVGDDLLRRVGGALKGALRESDVLARIGGDEFAVILPDTDAEGARAAARKLAEGVRQEGRVVASGRQADVTVSIGITALGPALQLDGEELLVEADLAMYQAKDGGKDRIAVYERGSGAREKLTSQTDWISRLRHAVEQERFVLHAQPVLPLVPDPSDAASYELLVRLLDDDGQLIPPAAFMNHAERHGLIGDIDRWVLEQAVGLLHTAERAGEHLQLGVNFSAETMQDPTIGRHLATLLEARPVRAGALVIEVTETAAIVNVAQATELARQLRELGCRLALDDFGAGFASFSYLKHLPFDVLKVDGEFIERLLTSTTDQLVVRAAVDIANGLGARVVAERVPDRATVELLREIGVHDGQGYFLGRPLPLDAYGIGSTPEG